MAAQVFKSIPRFALITLAFAASACPDEGTGQGAATAAPSTYSVSVTASGLNGTGLVLQNNGGGDLTVSASGSVTFSASLLSGSAYAVTVLTQPSTPDQTCSVTNGTSAVAQADVSNVTVACKENYVRTTRRRYRQSVGVAATQQIDALGAA